MVETIFIMAPNDDKLLIVVDYTLDIAPFCEKEFKYSRPCSLKSRTISTLNPFPLEDLGQFHGGLVSHNKA